MLLFDALLFVGRPDMTHYGLTPIKILGDDQLFPTGTDRGSIPAEQTLRAVSTDIHDLTVLNVEHWQDTTFYVDLLKRVHRLFPHLRVGYYGVVPKRDYWRALRETSDSKYLLWQAENDGLRPIAEQADVLFPSLYTFYTDQWSWVRYATANIAEARRCGRRAIYPFIWPQYHDSNATLVGQAIPGDYWRLQLETLKALSVDGIVIWGGWQTPWDPQAPWWLETLRFIEAN